jgi:hypothetical protein
VLDESNVVRLTRLLKEVAANTHDAGAGRVTAGIGEVQRDGGSKPARLKSRAD